MLYLTKMSLIKVVSRQLFPSESLQVGVSDLERSSIVLHALEFDRQIPLITRFFQNLYAAFRVHITVADYSAAERNSAS